MQINNYKSSDKKKKKCEFVTETQKRVQYHLFEKAQEGSIFLVLNK